MSKRQARLNKIYLDLYVLRPTYSLLYKLEIPEDLWWFIMVKFSDTIRQTPSLSRANDANVSLGRITHSFIRLVKDNDDI